MPDLVPHVLPAGTLRRRAHSPGDPASCRVAEKSGFALEGTRVRSLLHDDGWHDMHLHGRTADQ